MRHHQPLNEDSLKSNDLVDLVDRLFEVDNYKWILPSELSDDYNLHYLQREILDDYLRRK